ncbi:MAG: hypothetical protein WC197_07595 [Candidatus Gastranaerophilaceae bacterium]|jgi:hypothetical protein
MKKKCTCSKEQEIKRAREEVSVLIIKILISTLSVKEALMQFPKDIQDKSLECAWHAIIHYEADEEIRAKDNDYALEQDDYLEMIANILKEGEELPGNIIQNYDEYYEEVYLPKSASWLNTLKNLFRFTT